MSYQSNLYTNSIYTRQIADCNPLSKKEEKFLSDEIKKGGKRKKQAIQKLVSHNVKLVVTIAKSYANMGLEMDDLVSEGNLGLYDAATRFDADKGAKFSSYSSWWIKMKMRKALTNKSRNVRVPNSSLEKFNQVISFINKHEEEHGSKPSVDEIAKALNSNTKRIQSVVNAAMGTLSFDAQIDPDDPDSVSCYTLIKDTTVEEPSDSLLKKEKKDIVVKAIEEGNLTDREVKIIKGRFGFNGKRVTLEKMGEQLKITRERVRQIEAVALFKVKNYLESEDYKK